MDNRNHDSNPTPNPKPSESKGKPVAGIIQLPSLEGHRKTKLDSQYCEVCGDFQEASYREPRETRPGRLLSSSLAGCPSCSLVCHVIILQRYGTLRSLNVLERTMLPEGDVKLWVSGRGSLSVQHVHPQQEGISHVFVETGISDLWPIIRPDSSASRCLVSATNFIKAWKTRSVDPDPRPMPSRILEINGPQKVRLRETNAGDIGRYACLSYCWGRDPHKQLRTTKKNISEHKQLINWDVLPRTFQDALALTKSLGLRYLWIDSLCIVQDDLDDWRHEGGKMATVYSFSDITFAATSSVNSAGGLFNTVQDDMYAVHIAERLIEVRVQQSESSDLLYNGSLALTRRAWFFQERVLSPRLVHFTKNELFWEDETTVGRENCGFDNIKDQIPASCCVKFHELKNAKTHFKWWHNAVGTYTAMGLTFDSDIFPALQGVARRMQQVRKCSYYAGLWEDSLSSDLLWSCVRPRVRPGTYRAPTWSWASVKGRVSYIHRRTRMLASVQSVHTVPAGKSSLGEIQGGSLTLRGMGFCAYVTFPPKTSMLRYDLDISPSGHVHSKRFSRWKPDVEDALKDSKMTFMHMATMEDESSKPCECVFLGFRRVKDQIHLYERMGMWELEDVEAAADINFEQMEITIV